MENISVFFAKPVFLYSEMLIAYANLMYFAINTGPRSALDTGLEFDEYLHQISSILRRLALTVIMIFVLTIFPNESAAQWSAFLFAELIALITVIRMFDLATQSAILIVLKGTRNPEEAWKKMLNFDAIQITFWSISFRMLLSSPFADIPEELQKRDYFNEIALNAQNRILDRELGQYRRKYSTRADKYDYVAIHALEKSWRARLLAVTWGFGFLLLGCAITFVFLHL